MTLHKHVCLLLSAAMLGCLTAHGQQPVATVLVKLDAWADLEGVVHVRWITAQSDPAKCQVEYGPTADLGQSQQEDPSCLRGTTNNRDAGTGWANNHRADIEGIDVWPVHLRVTGVTRSGREFSSEIRTVRRPERPKGSVPHGRVRIALHPGNWKAEPLPITVGIPFPKGQWGDVAGARVLIEGTETLCGVNPVVRWREDQSIKWARVDFVAPAGAKEAVFEYGHEVKRRKSGPNAAPPDKGATSLPITAEMVDAQGAVYRDVIDRVELEETNPVKSVVKISGHYQNGDGSRLFAFVARCHAWPETGLTRLDYTIENDNTQSEFTSIRSLAVGLRNASQTARYTVGAPAESIELADGESVLQREDFEWIKQPGDAKGKRLDGLVRLGGDHWALMRHFWQQWPASVEVRQGRVYFGLCPALPVGAYENRPDEDKLYYQIRDGLHTYRQGFSKTWEIWIGRGDVAVAQSLLGERPVASVPPEWMEDSRALQGLGVSDRDQFPGYDEALAVGIEQFLQNRDREREYGMMNFGDWHGERVWNWGNLEYDLGHGFLTQFVRSEKPEFFRRAEEAIRHQRDVDTRHHASDPRRVGQQWTHSIGHTAGYYPGEYKDMKVYASPGWSDNRGHVWSQGMFEHYLLGGDRRSFDTAKIISDVYGGPGTTNYSFFNAREPGWIGKMQMAAYLATEDLFYLNAAKILMDAVHEKSLATGNHGFHYHKLPTGHCNCPDDQKHGGEAGFMLAVEMTAQRMYYEETRDERIAEDIVQTARFIADTMWVPAEKGFRYTSCPHTSASVGRAWIQLQGMAFAARHANDEKLADICRQSLAAGWSSLPTAGKAAGYILCASAQAMDEVGRLPGERFNEMLDRIRALIDGPAARRLPTAVPNPDFETDIERWPSRGWNVQRCTEVKHSGAASLKILGAHAGQGEFVNTTYDTASSPYEIKWLVPGEKYRLTAWLRVDRFSDGAAGPSVRIQFRDAGGSRASATTNRYDLTQLKSWQRLSADFTVPEYNTRNYLALNTGSRDEIDTEMYFDDISVVPLDAAGEETYSYLQLLPEDAKLTDGARLQPPEDLPQQAAIQNQGTASWQVRVPAAGKYRVWLRALSGGSAPRLAVGGEEVSAPTDIADATWLLLGKIDLTAEDHPITIKLDKGAAIVGCLVLTDDPTELHQPAHAGSSRK
ncbi:MAG: hypothetical protein GXY83_12620 [Rhodopirellula sp.]|nr:hypothetical protein [Rhodopirellula sp.]